MSNNIVPLKVVQLIDPICDLKSLEHRTYGVLNSGSEVSYQQYPAQAVSNGSIQITSLPPSDKTIIDPKVYALVTYRLTFAGNNTNAGGNLIQPGLYDAPRAFPLSSTVSNMSASINGQTISCVLNQYFQAFMRYGPNYDEYDDKFSTTPCQLDQCTDYTNLNNTNRSPFASFGENTEQQPRGGFSGISIVSNSPTACVLDLTIYEPLFLPGFMYNRHGLINIRSLNWLFTFQNLNRVWSHNAIDGNTITSLQTDITAFSLFYRFITPKSLELCPPSVLYNYNEIVPSNQSYGSAVASGAQVTIAMNALNLQSVPKMVVVFVRKQDSDLTFNDADSFFRIDNISVNYANRTGLLSSASVQSLYHITAENGCNSSWDMYNKYNGSVLQLKLGKDIGMRDLDAPGLLANPQLSLVVKATNISNSTITPMLFIMCVYEGVMTISNGSMSKSTACLSSQDILNTMLATASIEEVKKPDNYYGGDLVGGNIFESGYNLGKRIVEGVPDALEFGKDVLATVGLGKKKKGRGALTGGQVLSRSDLKQQQDMYDDY